MEVEDLVAYLLLVRENSLFRAGELWGDKVIFILSQDFPYKGRGLSKRSIGNCLIYLFQLFDIFLNVDLINFFKKLSLCHHYNINVRGEGN